MQIPATGQPDALQDAAEEARFRARMARAGEGRSSEDAPVRRRRRSGPRDYGGDGFRLGWKSWLAIDTLLVGLVVAGVVAWPPIQACRQQDRTVGFYAGDTVGKCVRRGVADRITRADQRVKMLIRGSGH